MTLSGTATNPELLRSIIEEATELLGFAEAGGDNEMAFDLTVDRKELQQSHDLLWELGTRVRMETNMEYKT